MWQDDKNLNIDGYFLSLKGFGHKGQAVRSVS